MECPLLVAIEGGIRMPRPLEEVGGRRGEVVAEADEDGTVSRGLSSLFDEFEVPRSLVSGV